MKKIAIQGMHCDACQKLITMELEDIGLKNLVKSFAQEEKNKGTLSLTESATEEEREKILTIINAMGDYIAS